MQIKASEFKAKCLKMIDEMGASGETVIITKHGKPVARLTPYTNTGKLFGFLQGQMSYKGDLTDYHDDSWKAWDEERNVNE